MIKGDTTTAFVIRGEAGSDLYECHEQKWTPNPEILTLILNTCLYTFPNMQQ